MTDWLALYLIVGCLLWLLGDVDEAFAASRRRCSLRRAQVAAVIGSIIVVTCWPAVIALAVSSKE